MWTSSSSSNSNPFTSPASHAILGNNTNNGNSTLPKSMEEIWRDITLASLQHHQHYDPSNNASRGTILQDFFGRDPPCSASPPPPPTMLTLSSVSNVSRLSLPFEGMVSGQNPVDGMKRFPESERISGERRHKRMIKNRESAARSRARKQAYTNELELEVANLLEENARLKKQQQQVIDSKQLCVAAAENHGYARKKGLHRTSTAPF